MDFSWVITGILGIIIISLIFWIKKLNTNYWEKLGMPYAVSSPLAGLKTALLPEKPSRELIIDMYKKLEGEKYGGGYHLFTPSLIFRDLELINQVLVKDFSHFEDRETQDDRRNLFSSSLFNLSGDTWRHARHKLTPTFTSGKLKRMFISMKESSDEVVNYLKDKEREDIEGKELMGKVVINVIGKVAFGLNIDSLNENAEKDNEFIKNSSDVLKPSFSVIFKIIWNKLLPMLKFQVHDNKSENFFRNLTKDLINHRVTSGERRNDFLQIMLDEKIKEDKFSQNEPKNVLSKNDAIESEDKELLDQLKNMQIANKCNSTVPNEIFTDEFMAAQSFTFIFGGSESTASAVTFLMYELAMNKDIQTKLQNEITDVLHSHEEFSYEAVSKMSFLEQCINETLRKYPFLPLLIRMCTRDYQLPGTDFTLEKGMLVFIPVLGLHYDSQYFEEPEKFDPDRFEDMKSIPKGSYLPFGGGPRFCIAMRLAILQMKVFVATLLSNYTVQLSEKTKLPLEFKKYSFFPAVQGGIWLKFKKREAQKLESQ